MIKQILTKNIGKINPLAIDDYIDKGGYQIIDNLADKNKLDLIKRVEDVKLYGRGGASFLTYLKMRDVYEENGEKYLICNADEGEPGNFKDKYLLENNPHQLIEGMIIAAMIVGVEIGYIYIREEYQKAKDILEIALASAREKKYLGENIWGFKFDIVLFSGAGSYLCGEETALISSLEGIRGKTREKPPFPTKKGLFEKPTLLLNVETLSNLPHIFDNQEYPIYGTKLISFSGNTENCGVYEVANDISIKKIIDEFSTASKIKAVILGGPSGSIVPYEKTDINVNVLRLEDRTINIGAGAIIIIDQWQDIVKVVKNNIDFFIHESCGKCTPCREGLTQIALLLDKFIKNEATREDMLLIEQLAKTISLSSYCGLGQYSVGTLLTSLLYFLDEYEKRIVKKGEIS